MSGGAVGWAERSEPTISRSEIGRMVGTLATMMGTLVMSRVAGSGELSDEILAAGREAALARAEATKPAVKKARAN